MPNNYTVSSVVTSELYNDSVASGTIASSATLIITPDTGYVIQASDFGIGTSLPAEVTSVVFSNTTIALDPTNKIKATVTLASWYTMPSANDTLEVDIDGRTHQYKPRLNFTVTTTTVSNIVQTYTIATGGTNSAATSGSIVTNTSYINIQQNQKIAVATLRLNCASSYHFSSIPSFTISSSNAVKWSSRVTTRVYNSDNQLEDITYEFYYEIGLDTIYLASAESIIFDTPVVAADRVSYTSISSVYYDGYKHQAILPVVDTQLRLNVNGADGSTYNIKIEDNLGLTYDFSTDTFTRSLTISNEQTIPPTVIQLENSLEPRKNSHDITIPTRYKAAAFEAYFTTTITPTGSTKTSVFGDTDPKTITLNQFGTSTYTFSSTASTYGVNVASAFKTISGEAFSIPIIFDPDNSITRDTSANGYFTTSQALNYSITDTVDGAFSGTNMVMDNTATAKKIQVGDTIISSDGNIPTATTITVIDPDDDNDKEFTISKTPSAQVADGATISFTRTVGISRQPIISDIQTSSPITSTTGITKVIKYQVKEATSNSTFANLQSLGSGRLGTSFDGDFDDLVVGMLVSGANIIGFPKITSISSSGEVVLTTNQSLSIYDNLGFSIAGSKLLLSTLNVSGAGTTDCKLNIDGSIARIGNNDVTASLLLQNFITTYVAPTAAALTATCPLGGTVTIRPLSSCTGHTRTLFVDSASFGVDGGLAVLSSDGTEIIFNAATSGTSHTLSYKVNDGVQLSSAADIVITFTP